MKVIVDLNNNSSLNFASGFATLNGEGVALLDGNWWCGVRGLRLANYCGEGQSSNR